MNVLECLERAERNLGKKREKRSLKMNKNVVYNLFICASDLCVCEYMVSPCTLSITAIQIISKGLQWSRLLSLKPMCAQHFLKPNFLFLYCLHPLFTGCAPLLHHFVILFMHFNFSRIFNFFCILSFLYLLLD
jgi:hypothetical protein